MLEILTPLCAQDVHPRDAKLKPPRNLPSTDISNVFSNLTVEEPLDEPSGQQLVEPLEDFLQLVAVFTEQLITDVDELSVEPVGQQPVEPLEDFPQPVDVAAEQPNTDVEYEADQTDDVSMRDFAVYCLFEDLNRLRTFLQDLWSKQKAGEIDLATAAVTTNTALDMVRRSEDLFFQDFPEESNYQILLHKFIATQPEFKYEDLGKEVEECAQSGKLHSLETPSYEAMKRVFLPAYLQLVHGNNQKMITERRVFWCPNCGNGMPHRCEQCQRVRFNPRHNRNTMSERQKKKDDEILLVEIFGEVAAMSSNLKGYLPAEDELIAGLRGMISGKPIRLALVFSLQTFLDISHIFRQESAVGLEELQRVGKHAIKTLEASLELFRKSSAALLEPGPESIRLQELVIQFIKKWTQDDEIANLCLPVGAKVYGPVRPPSYRLLRNHPLLCGLFCFSIKLQLQRQGLQCSHLYGAARYAAHLYNAIRQEGLCNEKWEKMERLLEIHPPQEVFLGSRPTSIEACDISLKLCRGKPVPESMLKSMGFNNEAGLPAKELWELKVLYPVSAALHPRYEFQRLSKPMDPVIAEIEQIFRSTADMIATNQDDPQKTSAKNGSSGKSKKPKKGHKKPKRQSQKAPQQPPAASLTDIEFLTNLQQTLNAEARVLHFDYLNLERDSIILFQALEQALGPQLRAFHGNNLGILGQHEPGTVVADILDAAAKGRKGLRKAAIGRQILAEVMEEWLRNPIGLVG